MTATHGLSDDAGTAARDTCRASGALARGTEDEAARHQATLRREGCLILESRLPPTLTADLRREYMMALEAKRRRFIIAPTPGDDRLERNDGVLADFRPEGGNHDMNRWNMHLPSRRPFLDPRLIADPDVLGILEGVLGKGFVLVSLLSDTAFPASGFQSVHQDDVLLRITINVPLVDVTPGNGPTEIWPRTHRDRPEAEDGPWSGGKYFLGAAEMDLRRHLPSIKPCVPAGSFIVRDHRLMHRGTPNRSSEPRPMLTLNYAPDPGQVTSRRARDAVARLALALRREGRSPRGPRHPGIAGAGHTINRVNEYLSGSDRDYRRPIPRDIWSSLTPAARHVLRHASVEDEPLRDETAVALRPTLRLLGHTAKSVLTMWRGVDDHVSWGKLGSK